MSPTVYRTGHQLMCEMLRDILGEIVQAGPRSAGGIGSIPIRAVAALYMLLMNHPVDRPGRCRSGRRPGAVCGARRRRCRVHVETSLWLHQPAEFVRHRLARELGLVADPAAEPAILGTEVVEILVRRDCPPAVLAHPALPAHRIILCTDPYPTPWGWSAGVHRVTGTLLLPPTVTDRGPVFWVHPPPPGALASCREFDVYAALPSALGDPPPNASPTY